jgi:hypothetical protein
MQSGDTISEHMYRNPITYTVSGVFSMNGINWNDNSYDFIQAGDRITNIQHVFEKIKDEGILCTLITVDSDAFTSMTNNNEIGENIINASTRFKIRKNMALQSISWTERQNSLKFNFTFYQIIMVEQQEYVNLQEQERIDLGLPNVSNPIGSSLGTVLADNGLLSQTVTKSLVDNGYIENDFLAACAQIIDTYATYMIASAVVSVAVLVIGASIKITAAAVAAGAGSVIGGTAAVFPVGTIIAAAVVVVAAVAVFIGYTLKRNEEQRKKRMAFKLINGSAEQDTARLVNLLDDIEVEVNQVNSNITVYTVQEDAEHQVVLNIAGNYYVINFKQNNTNNYGWSANVTDLDGNPITTMNKDKWCPVASFGDMNRNQNMWFKDSTKQYEVYLMNPALSPDFNPGEEELEVVRKKLSSYTIWVSFGNIEENIDKVYQAINKAIVSRGFK